MPSIQNQSRRSRIPQSARARRPIRAVRSSVRFRSIRPSMIQSRPSPARPFGSSGLSADSHSIVSSQNIEKTTKEDWKNPEWILSYLGEEGVTWIDVSSHPLNGFSFNEEFLSRARVVYEQKHNVDWANSESVLGLLRDGYGWREVFPRIESNLTHDREFLIKAVKHYGVAIKFAAPELIDDKDFIVECAKTNGTCINNDTLKKYWGDKDVVIAAIQAGSASQAYKKFPKDIWTDNDVMRAVAQDLVNNPALFSIVYHKRIPDELRENFVFRLYLSAIGRGMADIDAGLYLYSYSDWEAQIHESVDILRNDFGVTCEHLFHSRIKSADVTSKMLAICIEQGPEFLSEYTDLKSVLAKVLGVDALEMFALDQEGLSKKKTISTNRLRSLILETIRLYEQTGSFDVFSNFTVDSSVFDHKSRVTKFSHLLNIFNSIFGFVSADKGFELLACLPKQISAENLDEFLLLAQDLLTKAVQVAFDEFGVSIDITFEKLKKLEMLWGDLDPLFVLLSRYSSRNDWKVLIPVVGKIFESVLNDKFSEFKFEGDAQNEADIALAKRQRGHWSDEEWQAWKKPRAVAQVARPEGQLSAEENEQQALSTALNMIQYNLIPHLSQIDELTENDSLSESLASSIVDRFVKSSDAYNELIQFLESSGRLENESQIWSFVLNLLPILQTKGLKEIQIWSHLLRQLSVDYGLFESEIWMQVVEDLARIHKAASTQLEVKGEEVVVSVVTHDPKSLITIGNAVAGVASCQNYLTGGMIQTLPGYVIDAHVLAQLSFALNESNFNSKKEFQAVVWGLENLPNEISYDGGRNQIVFTFTQDGQRYQIKTRHAAAYRRLMLKSGDVIGEEKRGLFKEPLYSQVHAYSQLMAKLEHDLYRAIQRETHAVSGKSLHVAASRNIGGVYSDSFGGVVVGDYAAKSD